MCLSTTRLRMYVSYDCSLIQMFFKFCGCSVLDITKDPLKYMDGNPRITTQEIDDCVMLLFRIFFVYPEKNSTAASICSEI